MKGEKYYEVGCLIVNTLLMVRQIQGQMRAYVTFDFTPEKQIYFLVEDLNENNYRATF